MSTTWQTPISSFETNRRRVGALKSLGVVSVGDALTYYPFRVTDPVPARALREAKIGENMAFAAHVRGVRVFPMARRGFRLIADVDDGDFARSRHMDASMASLVFFSYRKSYVDWIQRKLHEGALLVVDASQGVQAQTISNLYMALEHDLEIIPVMNKCDMASAMPEEVEDEIIDLLGCKHEDIIRASGKTGMGVEEILKAVVERIPHPTGDEEAPLQALIFDSVFNSFRGIIAYFKIENGVIRKGDKVKFFNTGKEYDADEIGVLKMDMIPRAELRTGDVGYIISGIKTSREVKVGDTITHIARPC